MSEGFDGIIYSTVATRDVTELLLTDSAKIQKEVAGEKGAIPMFTANDVAKTMDKFIVSEWRNTLVEASNDLTITFLDAGHILGASISIIDINGAGKLVYTGDIGHEKSPIMSAPAKLEKTDFLIIESTYGAKQHPQTNPKNQLKQIIHDTYSNKGKVLIPVFAVGRAQEILYILKELYEEKELPNIPVYFDTPLGKEATSLYRHHQNYLRPEFRDSFLSGANPFHFGRLDFIKGYNRSLDVALSDDPCIIIAASGMLSGGRILNHLKTTLEDPASSLVFVGYQAEGTLGREIFDGEKRVEIDEKSYQVKLNIFNIPGLSAHADADGLFSFINSSADVLPKKIFVVHGELDNAEALQRKIIKELRIDTFVPERGYAENFMEREIIKIVEKDVHLDFTPRFVRYGEQELYPFAGVLLKKDNGVHLITEEQFMIVIREEKERFLKKVKAKIDLTEVKTETEEISETTFEALMKYAREGILSKKRARQLIKMLEEEGGDATIAHINALTRKKRLYTTNGEKEEKLRKILVELINYSPQRVHTLFNEIVEM